MANPAAARSISSSAFSSTAALVGIAELAIALAGMTGGFYPACRVMFIIIFPLNILE